MFHPSPVCGNSFPLVIYGLFGRAVSSPRILFSKSFAPTLMVPLTRTTPCRGIVDPGAEKPHLSFLLGRPPMPRRHGFLPSLNA
jgi:hypothetical protein